MKHYDSKKELGQNKNLEVVALRDTQIQNEQLRREVNQSELRLSRLMLHRDEENIRQQIHKEAMHVGQRLFRDVTQWEVSCRGNHMMQQFARGVIEVESWESRRRCCYVFAEAQHFRGALLLEHCGFRMRLATHNIRNTIAEEHSQRSDVALAHLLKFVELSRIFSLRCIPIREVEHERFMIARRLVHLLSENEASERSQLDRTCHKMIEATYLQFREDTSTVGGTPLLSLVCIRHSLVIDAIEGFFDILSSFAGEIILLHKSFFFCTFQLDAINNLVISKREVVMEKTTETKNDGARLNKKETSRRSIPYHVHPSPGGLGDGQRRHWQRCTSATQQPFQSPPLPLHSYYNHQHTAKGDE